jgi:hypothetical protein
LLLHGLCRVLPQVRKTWPDAQQHCKDVGGSLASIASGGEAGVVFSILSGWASSGQLGPEDIYSGRDLYVWLGATDQGALGRGKGRDWAS